MGRALFLYIPPDFLMGACSQHGANDNKRCRLYRKLWMLLNTLGLWSNEEYLRRKVARTVRHDRQDVMPNCVITYKQWLFPALLLLQEVRRRYPSEDGHYRDYKSTFDAENFS